MEKIKRPRRKHELYFTAAILAVAGAGFAYNHVQQKKPAATVEISIDGKVAEILDLGKDTEMTVHGYKNGTNHLNIQDGKVWIDEASCPDKICIQQGKIDRNSDMIVCLPNLMIVQIRSNSED